MLGNKSFLQTPFRVDINSGRISANSEDSRGHRLVKASRTLADILSIFANHQGITKDELDSLAYEVEVWMPDEEGVANKLQFGTSFLSPGRVNGEFYMTKGHFHRKREQPEIYWGITGQGLLLTMDENRQAALELVNPGSLHHISGHIAHRLINIGKEILTVGACWPLDAGHDYASLAQLGFSKRVFEQNGDVIVIEQS